MKMDRLTSIYSSFPGGLNEMVILGQEIGSNPRTLVLIHATRIVVVVFLSSLLILRLECYTEQTFLNRFRIGH